MPRPFPMTRVTIGLGIVVLLGGAGCATKGDLGTLNQEMTQKLEALDTTVHAQAETLRADLKAARATHASQYEELKTTLEAVKSDMATATMMTEYWSDTMQGLKKVATGLEEVNGQLPSLLTGLAREMRSLRQALLRSYQLEAAALRERLKTLEEMQQQLEASLERSPAGKFTAQ